MTLRCSAKNLLLIKVLIALIILLMLPHHTLSSSKSHNQRCEHCVALPFVVCLLKKVVYRHFFLSGKRVRLLKHGDFWLYTLNFIIYILCYNTILLFVTGLHINKSQVSGPDPRLVLLSFMYRHVPTSPTR